LSPSGITRAGAVYCPASPTPCIPATNRKAILFWPNSPCHRGPTTYVYNAAQTLAPIHSITRPLPDPRLPGPGVPVPCAPQPAGPLAAARTGTDCSAAGGQGHTGARPHGRTRQAQAPAQLHRARRSGLPCRRAPFFARRASNLAAP
jgi:hypothetical protein